MNDVDPEGWRYRPPRTEKGRQVERADVSYVLEQSNFMCVCLLKYTDVEYYVSFTCTARCSTLQNAHHSEYGHCTKL